jgi:hypothetical protein
MYASHPGQSAKKTRLLGLSVPMLLIGVGFLAAACFSYIDQNTGPEVTARVSSCSGSYGRYSSGVHCQATWVAGGALVGGNGHVVLGDVEDADYSDVGHTIRVGARREPSVEVVDDRFDCRAWFVGDPCLDVEHRAHPRHPRFSRWSMAACRWVQYRLAREPEQPSDS